VAGGVDLAGMRLTGISRRNSAGYPDDVTKRLVDTDDDLLEEATSVLGASTMKEAVHRALESVVLTDRRRRHADRLQAMEGLDLDRPEVMAGAWR
jgi:Arc/MetJ family transcription regulator